MSYDYFKHHPLRVPKDQSNVSISTMLTAETKHCGLFGNDVPPAMGAFIHYGGVELADKLFILQPECTEDELQYLRIKWAGSCGDICRLILFYVWRIIAREQRHGSTAMADKAFGEDQSEWTPGQTLVYNINKHNDYADCLLKGGDVTLGDYVSAVEQHYRHGDWHGSYGGKKWADIALILLRYIRGETSAMVAADRAWTLVHNTGPIFNKGFYFLHHDGLLMDVLNLQASSTVFKMKDKVTEAYKSHNLSQMAAFNQFFDRASEIIRRADPDYEPTTPPPVKTPGGTDHPVTEYTAIGSVRFAVTSRETINDA